VNTVNSGASEGINELRGRTDLLMMVSEDRVLRLGDLISPPEMGVRLEMGCEGRSRNEESTDLIVAEVVLVDVKVFKSDSEKD
jgi:hypothetical protein